MKPWINFHHLNYFRVIALEGSIKAASVKLALGQSSLSAQLKLFESTLGVSLFERRGKSLHLTEAGGLVLAYAKDISQLGEELLDMIRDGRDRRSFRLQLGVMEDIPKGFVTDLIVWARKFRPCAVEIREADLRHLTRELLNFHLDLILSDHVPSVSDTTRIYARRVNRMPVSFYGSRPFLGLKKRFPQSLDGQPMILPTAHCRLRSDLGLFFHREKINPVVVTETQDTALQKQLALEGLGLIALSEMSGERLQDQKLLHKIGPAKGVFQSVYLIGQKRKIDNPVASHLLDEFSL